MVGKFLGESHVQVMSVSQKKIKKKIFGLKKKKESKISEPSQKWEFTETQLKSPASSVGWTWFWQTRASQPPHQSNPLLSPPLVVIKFSVYRFNMSWQAQRQAELRRRAPSVSYVAVKHWSEEHRRATLSQTESDL